MGVSIATKPQNSVGKGKYKCRYCNEALKFQLVEVNINANIASLNEKSTLNAISTCMVASK
jgi:hypothetical protein